MCHFYLFDAFSGAWWSGGFLFTRLQVAIYLWVYFCNSGARNILAGFNRGGGLMNYSKRKDTSLIPLWVEEEVGYVRNRWEQDPVSSGMERRVLWYAFVLSFFLKAQQNARYEGCASGMDFSCLSSSWKLVSYSVLLFCAHSRCKEDAMEQDLSLV